MSQQVFVIYSLISSNLECAQSALALINAMFGKQEDPQKFYHEILDWNIRVNIEVRVIQHFGFIWILCNFHIFYIIMRCTQNHFARIENT